MRIISQDGMFDLNYDNLELRIELGYKNEECYINHSSYNLQGSFTLGKYSSREKALKVMEMIREHHSVYMSYVESGIGVTNKGWLEFAYFQMPTNEEVE